MSRIIGRSRHLCDLGARLVTLSAIWWLEHQGYRIFGPFEPDDPIAPTREPFTHPRSTA